MRFLALFALLFAAFCAHAQVEIIPLRHRTVDQVLPVLRPLVEPGGALSGTQGQIIIRASPANIADIRRVLERIDSPSRRLLISVRQDSGESASASSASGRVVIANRPQESSASVRIGESGTARDERVEQQVQALEGSPATISMGTATRFREFSTGFEVVPRVAGDRVFLEVGARRELQQGRGQASVQRVATSASGKLGEWFEIGALVQQAAAQSGGILSSGSSRQDTVQRVWVKVEELK
jgi:type II secretory pathway component GspD/PulD (secretin)